MHLLPSGELREALNQAADRPQVDEGDRHLVRKLLLHPRAFRVFHETLDHRMEQDRVEAMAAAVVGGGGLMEVVQYIIAHFPEIVADILAALRMFKIVP